MYSDDGGMGMASFDLRDGHNTEVRRGWHDQRVIRVQFADEVVELVGTEKDVDRFIAELMAAQQDRQLIEERSAEERR